MNRIIFIVSLLSLSLGIIVSWAFFLFEKRDLTQQGWLPDIIAEIAPSVVSISGTITDESGVTSREGTGIVVWSDGLILTSKHLVSPWLSYVITLQDGMKYSAILVKNHPSLDLALLSIIATTKLSLPVGEFINSHVGIRQGKSVIAIGNMLGLYPWSVSSGIISGLNRTVSFGWVSMDWLIQTDLPMYLGNSWGPLITSDGKIIGINTGVVGGSSQIGWAIPITQSEINDFILWN
jgi:S1-C subfamily serine protease